MSCTKRVPLERLVDYWSGDLSLEESEQTEGHLFECASCTSRLTWIAGVDESVRDLVRGGRFGLPVTRRLVDRLLRDGLVIRQYQIAPGGSVHCSAAPEDHFGITWMTAELADAERVDVELTNLDTGARMLRAEDVPFDRDLGLVGLAASSTMLRALPAHTLEFRVTKFVGGAEREIGRYSMMHSPYRSD